MKTYRYLYSKILDKNAIKEAILKAAKRKTKRKDVKKILENIDEYANELYEILKNEEFVPDFHIKKVINENSCGKTREIVKPNYKWEQIEHKR